MSSLENFSELIIRKWPDRSRGDGRRSSTLAPLAPVAVAGGRFRTWMRDDGDHRR